LLWVADGAVGAKEAPPMVTDRPDVTESAETVPRGLVQIEAGYTFINWDDADETLDFTAFPSTLVRVGLDDRVELRLGWLGWVSESRKQDGVRTDDAGAGDTVLGVKIKLRDELGAAPKLAVLAGAILPTGRTASGTERIEPAVRFAGSHTLSDRFALGYNLGIVALPVEDDGGEIGSYGVGLYSASLGIGISARWSSFVEVFGFIPASGPECPANSIDAGFAFLSSKTVQLDLSGGFGLNDDANDWFVSAGFSIRLPR
jgi:hypothetical protein